MIFNIGNMKLEPRTLMEKHRGIMKIDKINTVSLELDFHHQIWNFLKRVSESYKHEQKNPLEVFERRMCHIAKGENLLLVLKLIFSERMSKIREKSPAQKILLIMILLLHIFQPQNVRKIFRAIM